MYGVQIGGNLECDGSSMVNPAMAGLDGSGLALIADSANVTGDVLLRRRFHSWGTVSLYNARIGGSLDCDEGTFQNPAQKGVLNSGTALNVGAARVAGGVLLRSKTWPTDVFLAKGAVRMYGIQVEGSVECDGSFENPAKADVAGSGLALQADVARVNGNVLLRKSFSANGLVRLYGAQIGGSLECSDGKFKNEGVGIYTGMGTALNAVNIKVTGDVMLNGLFVAEDAVTFSKARIGGRLETNGGTFHSLDLGDASAGAIVDDVDGEDWERPQTRLNLDGFTYERISRVASKDPLEQAIEEMEPAGEAANIPHRLQWLEMQTKFTRQPYRRLAKVLRDTGDDKGFRRVCMRMEERAREGQSWWRRFFGHVLRLTIGYGYASQRAVYWVLGLIAAGTLVFWHGRAMMVPTQKDAYVDFVDKKDTPAYYGRFHALAYSVDNSFPLVKLGMQEKWAPRERVASDTARPANWLQWIDWRLQSPGFLRCFRWAQIGAGWILTTLFAVGVTGLIRED
jgi:hypothetical protein